MANIIDSLIITLGVDPKGVSAGMARAENNLATSAKNIISNILAPLATALALGGAFKEFISSSSQAATLSAELGVSGEDIQSWGQAVDRAGGSAEGFEGSLISLNSKMLEFSHIGTSSAAPALAQLGISARNADGSIKSSIEIMKDLASAATSIDPKRFTAIASSLGIDSGTITLLRQGSSAVDELVARQKVLGVYTKEDGAMALKMANAFKDFMQVMKSVSAMIMRLIVPPFTAFTEKLINLVTYIKAHDAFIKTLIGGIAGAITALLLPAIIKAGAAMLLNPLTWIFLLIAAAVAYVALVIDDLYVYIKGGNSAFASFWSKFGTGAEVAEKLAIAFEFLKLVFAVVWEVAKGFFRLLIKNLGQLSDIFGNLNNIIISVFDLLISLFNLDFTGVLNAFKSINDALLNIIASMVNMFLNFLDFVGLKEPLLKFFSWLDDKVQAVFGKISGVISPVVNGIKSVVGGIASFFGGDDPSTTLNSNIIAPARALDSLPAASYSNSNKTITSNSQVSVGAVNIQTAATDPKIIAQEMPKAVESSFKKFGITANTGMGVK